MLKKSLLLLSVLLLFSCSIGNNSGKSNQPVEVHLSLKDTNCRSAFPSVDLYAYDNLNLTVKDSDDNIVVTKEFIDEAISSYSLVLPHTGNYSFNVVLDLKGSIYEGTLIKEIKETTSQVEVDVSLKSVPTEGEGSLELRFNLPLGEYIIEAINDSTEEVFVAYSSANEDENVYYINENLPSGMYEFTIKIYSSLDESRTSVLLTTKEKVYIANGYKSSDVFDIKSFEGSFYIADLTINDVTGDFDLTYSIKDDILTLSVPESVIVEEWFLNGDILYKDELKVTDNTVLINTDDNEVFNVSVKGKYKGITTTSFISIDPCASPIFEEQSDDLIYELYDGNEHSLNVKLSVPENIQYVYSAKWYKVRGEDYDYIEETEETLVPTDGYIESSYKIPESSIINEDYACKVSYTRNNVTKTVTSRTFNVTKTLNTGLPTVSIKLGTISSLGEINKETYLDGNFAIDSEGGFESDFSLKGRGNTSFQMPKKSYNIKFNDKKKILGMSKSKKWVLIANYADKTLLRNQYASYLGNEIFTNMPWAPSFKSINLVMNNEYLGTYLIGESIKIDSKKVNIQDISDTEAGKGEDLNGDNIVDYKDGGFIMEIDAGKDGSYYYTTKEDITFCLKDPDLEDFQDPEAIKEHISNIIQTAEDALYSDSWLDSDEGYTKYIDQDSFVDWLLVHEYAKNADSRWLFSCFTYYNPKDGKIYMGPDWDYDSGFGNNNNYDCENTSGLIITESGWHKRLMEDPDFKSKVSNRWKEVSGKVEASIEDCLQKEADYLTVSADYNFKTWPILGQYIHYSPKDWWKRTTYKSEVDFMKNWLSERIKYLDTAF